MLKTFSFEYLHRVKNENCIKEKSEKQVSHPFCCERQAWSPRACVSSLRYSVHIQANLSTHFLKMGERSPQRTAANGVDNIHLPSEQDAQTLEVIIFSWAYWLGHSSSRCPQLMGNTAKKVVNVTCLVYWGPGRNCAQSSWPFAVCSTTE